MSSYTQVPLRWCRSTTEITGRFVIIRVPRPRKWVLWDISDVGALTLSPPGYRVGSFTTLREAREEATKRATTVLASAPYSNMGIVVGILPA